MSNAKSKHGFLQKSLMHPNWWYYKQNIPWFIRPFSKSYHLKFRTNPIVKTYSKMRGKFPGAMSARQYKFIRKRMLIVDWMFGQGRPSKPIMLDDKVHR